jgi:hypothetical protein
MDPKDTPADPERPEADLGKGYSNDVFGAEEGEERNEIKSSENAQLEKNTDQQNEPDDSEKPEVEIEKDSSDGLVETELMDESKASVNIQAEGNNSILVGGDVKDSAFSINNYYNNPDKERKRDETGSLGFAQLDEKYINKYVQVFVEPEHYSTSLDTISRDESERLFIIQGLENSGKFITAVNFGLHIFRNQDIHKQTVYFHIGKDISIRSLFSFFEGVDAKEPAIYIIRDAFNLGLSISDFSDTILSINNLLRTKKSLLILTTTKSKQDIEDFKLHIVSSHVVESRLPECFLKHLNYSEKIETTMPIQSDLVLTIRNNLEEIDKDFKSPGQIDYFFEKIRRDGVQINTNEPVMNSILDGVIQIAQDARKYGLITRESTRLWFEGLPENVQLFALLSVILQGFKFEQLEGIYEKAVIQLIDSKVSTIEHYAVIGRDKIISALHAKIENEGYLNFESQSYLLEIRRQIDNRHLLLWPLVDLFIEYIYEFKSREHWLVRRELGAAIGRIGVYGYGKLENVLDDLARHEDGGVVASAGYALAEICNLDSKHFPYVINILKRWLNSGDPDLMWAVGASVWRIYDTLIRLQKNEKATSLLFQKTEESTTALLECLTELTSKVNVVSQKFRHKFTEDQLALLTINNISSVLHAVREMFWLNPSGAVSLIDNWINFDQQGQLNISNIKNMGLLSAHELFKRTGDAQKTGLYNLSFSLVDLTKSLLTHGDQDTIDLMFRVFRNWTSEPELSEQFMAKFDYLLSQLNVENTHRFRTGIIRTWLIEEAQYAHEIGGILINKSYESQGSPLGISPSKRIFLLWDVTLGEKYNDAYKTIRDLYIRINARQRVDLYPLGQMEKLIPSSGYPSGMDDK